MPKRVRARESKKHLTPEQRVDAVRSVSAGRSQAEVAKSYGVSRQAISFLMKRPDRPRKRTGRTKMERVEYGLLTAVQLHQLEIEIAGRAPARGEAWTCAALEALVAEKFGIEIPPQEFSRLCRRLAVSVYRVDPESSPKLLTSEYYAWLESPVATALFQREAFAWEKEIARRRRPDFRHYARGGVPPVDEGGPRHPDPMHVDGLTGQLVAWRNRINAVNPGAPRLPEPPWSPGRKSVTGKKSARPKQNR